MRKLQYSVYKQETGSAGGKAKNDAFDILLANGFAPSYKPSHKRSIRIIQQYLSLRKIKKDTLLFVQYPAISDALMKKLVKRLKKTKATSVALVHDLPSIQGMGGETDNEIKQLNAFDYLIVHNEKMDAYLKEKGYQGKTVILGVFDYLHDIEKPVCDTPYENRICIAGNLDKGAYIRKVDELSSYQFNLYGVNRVLDLTQINNAQYKGCLPSDEIVYLLDGDFGLVWDGESLDECSGIYGKYLLYNNPHKLSLYLSSGKPVIVWKQSALAPFVEENGLGVAVGSLAELERLDLRTNYASYKQNVMEVKKKLGSGYYLTQAIARVMEDIEKETEKK